MSIVFTCKECGKEFKERPSYKDIKKFCSRRCYAKWQSKNKLGRNHPSYVERLKIECKVCSKPILILPSDIKYKRYCSRRCTHIAQSQRMSGKNNPSWEGGISEKWQRWGEKFSNHYKKQVKERDNHTCQNCGLKEIGSKVKFVIHHRDINPKNGVLSNLQLLCNPCHISIHRNL